MKKMKWIPLVCAVLLLALCVTGCGSKMATDVTAEASAPQSAGNSSNSKFDYFSEADSALYSDSGLNYVTVDAADAQMSPDSKGSQPQSAGAVSVTQKLIYTIDLNVETLDYEKSLDTIEQLTAEVGGYVEYAQVDNNRINSKWLRSANFTLRVPAAQLEQFLESCGTVGNVCSSARRTENRTTEYADLSARLKTLRIEEDTLQELLGKAEDLETIVSLNAYLSDVRYEIERVEANMRGIDGLVSYSTVNLYLEEVTAATESVTPKSSFRDRVSARRNDTWRGFRHALEAFGVYVLGELPLVLLSILLYLTPIVIVIIVLVAVSRRIRRKRRAKKFVPPDAKDNRAQE